MKKITSILVAATILISGPSVFLYSNKKVEAAEINYNFNDEKRVSVDTFTVQNNTFYTKLNKKLVKPKEKLTSNKQLVELSKVFYDEKRYYSAASNREGKPEGIFFSACSTKMACEVGNYPYALEVLTNTKYKDEGILVKNRLYIEYDLYDSIKKVDNSYDFRIKILKSLNVLYGKDGNAMYNYIMSIHKKYYNKVPPMGKSYKFTKKIGKTNIVVVADDVRLYVFFS